MTDEQRKEAVAWVDRFQRICSTYLWGVMGTCDNCKNMPGGREDKYEKCQRNLCALRSALEPKTVTIEDANNLFPSLYAVYDADGDVRTAFILWLKERGIAIKE